MTALKNLVVRHQDKKDIWEHYVICQACAIDGERRLRLDAQQQTILRDLRAASYNASRIEWFNLRPPLLCELFRSITEFWRHCDVVPPRTRPHPDGHGIKQYRVADNGFYTLDGGRIIVRTSSIDQVLRRLDGFHCDCANEFRESLEPYRVEVPPVPTILFWNRVHPKHASNWIWALVVLFGEYDTLLEFNGMNAREALRAAKVVRFFTERSRKELLSRWILKELLFWGVGNAAKGMHITDAERVLKALFDMEMPNPLPIPRTAIADVDAEADEECARDLALATASHEWLTQFVPGLPANVDNNFVIDPRDINGDEERLRGTTDQWIVVDRLRQELLAYPDQPLRWLFLGPPGVGKTHAAILCAARLWTFGFQSVIFTATTASRAEAMNGVHIHWLFGFPVNLKGLSHVDEIVSRFVEVSLRKLEARPSRKFILRRAQVNIFFIFLNIIVPDYGC